ncbi:MAG TPA: DUF2807 domain-containing protein [Sphingomonas sp.]|jgi:hypothetical protein
MRSRTIPILLAFVAAGAASAADAPRTVELPRFTSLKLMGGGEVALRHGSTQRVTVAGRDPSRTVMRVDDRGTLVIRACEGDCRGHSPRIEIVTPAALAAVAISGGGRITGEGRWPARRSLAVAIEGGGQIDTTALDADDVAAAVSGGGSMTVSARKSLAAVINGGGRIAYRGDPRTTRVINGGGAVVALRDQRR